jgi:hypothetical protein
VSFLTRAPALVLARVSLMDVETVWRTIVGTV